MAPDCAIGDSLTIHHEHGDDFHVSVKDGGWFWLTVGSVSLKIKRLGEGVNVEAWELGEEGGEPDAEFTLAIADVKE